MDWIPVNPVATILFIDGGFISNCSSWAFVSFNNDNFTHVYFSDFGISENLTDAQGAELDVFIKLCCLLIKPI